MWSERGRGNVIGRNLGDATLEEVLRMCGYSEEKLYELIERTHNVRAGTSFTHVNIRKFLGIYTYINILVYTNQSEPNLLLHENHSDIISLTCQCVL